MAEKQEIEVVLFGHETSKDLRIEYPELADDPDFQDLNPSEVRLVWLIGNRTSPLFKDHDKIEKAIKTVYPKYFQKPELQEMYEGNLPTRIEKAIISMEKYNPSLRLESSLIQRWAIDRLKFIISMKSETELKDMEMGEIKQYADIVKSIEKDLPAMVKRVEASSGIKTYERSSKKRVLVNINDGVTNF